LPLPFYAHSECKVDNSASTRSPFTD